MRYALFRIAVLQFIHFRFLDLWSWKVKLQCIFLWIWQNINMTFMINNHKFINGYFLFRIRISHNYLIMIRYDLHNRNIHSLKDNLYIWKYEPYWWTWELNKKIYGSVVGIFPHFLQAKIIIDMSAWTFFLLYNIDKNSVYNAMTSYSITEKLHI